MYTGCSFRNFPPRINENVNIKKITEVSEKLSRKATNALVSSYSLLARLDTMALANETLFIPFSFKCHLRFEGWQSSMQFVFLRLQHETIGWSCIQTIPFDYAARTSFFFCSFTLDFTRMISCSNLYFSPCVIWPS